LPAAVRQHGSSFPPAITMTSNNFASVFSDDPWNKWLFTDFLGMVHLERNSQGYSCITVQFHYCKYNVCKGPNMVSLPIQMSEFDTKNEIWSL